LDRRAIPGREMRLFNRLRRHLRAHDQWRLKTQGPRAQATRCFAALSLLCKRRAADAISGRELRLFNRLRHHFRSARLAKGLNQRAGRSPLGCGESATAAERAHGLLRPAASGARAATDGDFGGTGH
jgi:hypothetical protein